MFCDCVFAARRKLLEKARQAGSGGLKKTSGTEPIVEEMWEGGEGKPLNVLVCSVLRFTVGKKT